MKKLLRFILNAVPRKYLIRLSYVFMPFGSYFYRGNNVECPVCGGRFRKFMPYGYHATRENVLCPKCLSLERHRLMWLYLKNKTGFFTRPMKVLHIAPEQCFYRRFKKLGNLDYLTADLESPLADIKFDIQQIPLPDATFDMVICNHVLEHVEDDLKAMHEIHRILKPGGIAIMQVPMIMDREKTFEDPSITDPADRLIHFHQKDHFRIYGTDFNARAEKAGFRITENNYCDEIGNRLRERYRLPQKEFMFGYRK